MLTLAESAEHWSAIVEVTSLQSALIDPGNMLSCEVVLWDLTICFGSSCRQGIM